MQLRLIRAMVDHKLQERNDAGFVKILLGAMLVALKELVEHMM